MKMDIKLHRHIVEWDNQFLLYGNLATFVIVLSLCACCLKRKRQPINTLDDTNDVISSTQESVITASATPPVTNRKEFRMMKPYKVLGIQPSYEDLLPYQKPTTLPEAPTVNSENVGTISFSISYDIFEQILKVLIQKASGLPAKDLFGTSDPYVKIQLRPASSINSQKLSTRVRMRNLNPKWNQVFRFEGFPHEKLLTKSLHLEVFDYDRFSRDDALGEFDIQLSDVVLQKEPVEFEKQLVPSKNSRGHLGDLLISTCYNPSASCILIIIMKCSRLKHMSTKTHEHYVKLVQLYGGRKMGEKKTKTIRRCLSPVWNEAFEFDIPVDRLRSTSFSFSIKEYEKVLPNKCIGKVTIGHQATPAGSAVKHWIDTLNSPRKAIAMWHTITKN